MPPLNISIPQREVAEFCRRHGIRKLSLFGSVLSDRFRPDSNIDVLVELADEQPVGLIALAAMEIELGEILGRKVDLRTPSELSRYFRDEVLRTAVVQYAA